jgi:hypothetical protein
MISLIKTFTFWLIAGIIVTLLVTMVLPKLKSKAVEGLPGREEAVKIMKQARQAIKNLQEKPIDAPAPVVEKQVEPQVAEAPAPMPAEDSLKERDAKLFKRQCAILDDLL